MWSGEARTWSVTSTARPSPRSSASSTTGARPTPWTAAERGQNMGDRNRIDREDLREVVREKYGAAARIVLEGRGEACCGTGNVDLACCGASHKNPITSDL